MRPSLRWSLAGVLLVGAVALAQPYSGTWTGPGGQVRLTQDGEVVTGAMTVEARSGRLRGAVHGDHVGGLWATTTESGSFFARLDGAVLTLTFDDGDPLSFKRVAAPEPVAAAPAPKTLTPGEKARPAAKPPAGRELRGALCAESDGPGPAWTRRFAFDGKGHLAVGADLLTRRRGAPANERRLWVEDVGTYRVHGSKVSMRIGHDELTCLAGSRDSSGRVTEMLCGGRLYETTTCQVTATAR